MLSMRFRYGREIRDCPKVHSELTCPVQYTGELCSPEKREAIVSGVRNGQSVLTIAAEAHCAPNTVQVVRDQEMKDWKQEQSHGLKRVARTLIGHMNDTDPKDIPWSVKPVMLGIIMDKISMLDGEPSQIIETRHKIDISVLKSSITSLPEIAVDALPLGDTSAITPDVTQ